MGIQYPRTKFQTKESYCRNRKIKMKRVCLIHDKSSSNGDKEKRNRLMKCLPYGAVL